MDFSLVAFPRSPETTKWKFVEISLEKVFIDPFKNQTKFSSNSFNFSKFSDTKEELDFTTHELRKFQKAPKSTNVTYLFNIGLPTSTRLG